MRKEGVPAAGEMGGLQLFVVCVLFLWCVPCLSCVPCSEMFIAVFGDVPVTEEYAGYDSTPAGVAEECKRTDVGVKCGCVQEAVCKCLCEVWVCTLCKCMCEVWHCAWAKYSFSVHRSSLPPAGRALCLPPTSLQVIDGGRK